MIRGELLGRIGYHAKGTGDSGPCLPGLRRIHDWNAMERLHQKGYLADPRGKAKSVVITDEGRIKAEQLFRPFFTRERQGLWDQHAAKASGASHLRLHNAPQSQANGRLATIANVGSFFPPDRVKSLLPPFPKPWLAHLRTLRLQSPPRADKHQSSECLLRSIRLHHPRARPWPLAGRGLPDRRPGIRKGSCHPPPACRQAPPQLANQQNP
jgi:hypothetical protein